MRLLLCLICFELLPDHFWAADPVTEKPDPERTIPLKLSSELQALFTFNMGFKPSDEDPAHRSVLKNKDGTLVGCTLRPATETGYVYLFVTRSNGDVLVMQDLNKRLARLFHKLPSGFEEECIVLEGISGRTLALSSSTHSKLPPVDFRVRVGDDGSLTLLKP